MQTAAEDARNNSLTQFQADAKTHVEKIHERSATEANTLRRQADDDVAAVRDWSKAEIARIREETETKITARKGRLETEIEQHAAMIEREIEQVQGRVSAFEDEMAQFFERLLAEEDPTHFATMAENLPEPPSFDEAPVLDPVEFAAQIEYETAVAEPVADEADGRRRGRGRARPPRRRRGRPTVGDDGATEACRGRAGRRGRRRQSARPRPRPSRTAEGGWSTGDGDFPAGEAGEGGEIDREAAFAAIQAAAEAAASAEVATDAAARAEAVADIAIEIVGAHETDDEDPRVSALGLSPDFDAAEAEAASAGDTGEEIAEDQRRRPRGTTRRPRPRQERARRATPTRSRPRSSSSASSASPASPASSATSVACPASSRSACRPGPTASSSSPSTTRPMSRSGTRSRACRASRLASPARADGVLNVTAHDPESDN